MQANVRGGSPGERSETTGVGFVKEVVFNIICLSATQLMHAPVHGVRNTVQQTAGVQNSQLHFS